jgi:bifunctional DNase/RNase
VVLLEASFVKAVISEVQEARHFFASLELMRDDQPYLLPCRPSDALALVARSPEAVLYATEEVLSAAGQYPGATGASR